MTHDVEGRLARGRPVVDDFGEYVRACQHVGYSHSDLTMRPDQVHEWYATEDGLRLDALAAMSGAAEGAARRQSELVTGLQAAWSGHGADSGLEFLARNQHAAMTAAIALRDAARTLTSLREDLWNAVDAKVSATLAVDVGRRAEWLAAARTVTSGTGDRSTACELIDREVKPFVHQVIGAQWVGAMRSHTAAVQAAYRAALTRLDAAGETVFEVPGQLGPQSPEKAPPPEAGGRGESGGAFGSTPSAFASPAAVAPASFSAPPAPSAGTVAPASPGAESPPQQPLSAPSAAPASSPFGDLGSLGSGSPAAGLGGFGQQLSDLLGGLLGDAGDDVTDRDPLDSEDEHQAEEDEPDGEDDGDDEDEADAEDEGDAEDEAEHVAEAGESLGDPVPPDAVVAEPKPPPPAATTVVEPAPLPPSGAAEAALPPPAPTPCEVAADELPQVGE